MGKEGVVRAHVKVKLRTNPSRAVTVTLSSWLDDNSEVSFVTRRSGCTPKRGSTAHCDSFSLDKTLDFDANTWNTFQTMEIIGHTVDGDTDDTLANNSTNGVSVMPRTYHRIEVESDAASGGYRGKSWPTFSVRNHDLFMIKVGTAPSRDGPFTNQKEFTVPEGDAVAGYIYFDSENAKASLTKNEGPFSLRTVVYPWTYAPSGSGKSCQHSNATAEATVIDHPRALVQTWIHNQQNWDTLRPERSGVGLRSGKLPDGPVVASSPFDCLGLHLLSS